MTLLAFNPQHNGKEEPGLYDQLSRVSARSTQFRVNVTIPCRVCSTTTLATPAAVITPLQDRVNSAEWQALDTKYGVQSPDAFSYVIDAGGKSVTTYDSAQNPEPLAGVLDQLLQLLQSVNSTGYSGIS